MLGMVPMIRPGFWGSIPGEFPFTIVVGYLGV
jgi:hypothetical protein